MQFEEEDHLDLQTLRDATTAILTRQQRESIRALPAKGVGRLGSYGIYFSSPIDIQTDNTETWDCLGLSGMCASGIDQCVKQALNLAEEFIECGKEILRSSNSKNAVFDASSKIRIALTILGLCLKRFGISENSYVSECLYLPVDDEIRLNFFTRHKEAATYLVACRILFLGHVWMHSNSPICHGRGCLMALHLLRLCLDGTRGRHVEVDTTCFEPFIWEAVERGFEMNELGFCEWVIKAVKELNWNGLSADIQNQSNIILAICASKVTSQFTLLNDQLTGVSYSAILIQCPNNFCKASINPGLSHCPVCGVGLALCALTLKVCIAGYTADIVALQQEGVCIKCCNVCQSKCGVNVGIKKALGCPICGFGVIPKDTEISTTHFVPLQGSHVAV